MKTKFFAAALAALTLATAGAASAQDFRRGDRDRWSPGFAPGLEITIRKNGRTMQFTRDDRIFYRLMERPYNFVPGMTYAYTDRCNRQGCVAFVFDGRHRRPVDRIFAPHLQMRGYAWREARDFDRSYNRYGDYDRDDRNWNNEDDRNYRNGRDGRFDDRRDDRNSRDRGDWLEGGPTQRR